MRIVAIAALAILAVAASAHGDSPKHHHVDPAHDRGVGRIDGDEYELLKVMVVNRHGHRAPNAPFWTLCPTEVGNREKFGTGPEDLTSVGFDEEYRCGVYVRDMYPDFVGNDYDRTKHWVQAVGEPRTLQSAMAIANGAFPSTKKTPSALLPHHPNLIPVFSDDQNREYLLNDIPCKTVVKKMIAGFLEGEGPRIYDDHRKLIEHIFDVCETPKKAATAVSPDMLIKLVVDGIIFEHDFGIEPLKGKLTPSQFMGLRNLSNAFLFGKLYGTDEERTFYAGEFPHYILGNFASLAGERIKNVWRDNQLASMRLPLDIFVMHREELYGLAFFFDWRYEAAGMARGEVPAGTSYILEFLKHKKTGKLSMRVKMWNPREGEIPVRMPQCKDPHMCTREEVTAAYNERVKRTGRWDEICGYPMPRQIHPPKHD